MMKKKNIVPVKNDKQLQLMSKTVTLPKLNGSSSSMNLTDSEHTPSIRSRKSILQGSSCFVWNQEKVRPSQPYYNHHYDIPFNLPPNEVNFMGGLGQKRGNLRSKVHPNRTTKLQEILNMKTSNRILTTFTQDAKDSNCCVHVKRPFSSNNLIEKIKKIVNNIRIADNFESPPCSEVSDTFLDESQRRKSSIIDTEDLSDKSRDFTYFYGKDEIKQHIKRVLDEERERFDIKSEIMPEKTFREWAMDERKKFQDKLSEQEKSDFMMRSRRITNGSDTEKMSVSSNRTRGDMRDSELVHCDKIKHLQGYLYGEFTPIITPDKLTNDKTKFAIPLTMLKRYEKDYAKQTVRKNLLRRARFSHMGIHIPPENNNEDESSEGSVEEVKTLALIRTPYFRLPTIKTQQKKKKERFKNCYLNKVRLRRITMLLYDRSLSKLTRRAKRQGESTVDGSIDDSSQTNKTVNIKQTIGKKATKSFADIVRKRFNIKVSPTKEKYFKLIREKYLKHRQLYEDTVEASQNKPTFEEFKIVEQLENNQEKTNIKSASIIDKKTVFKLNENKKLLFKRNPPKTIFNRKRHERLSRDDDYVGPLYTDPYLMEKFRDPWKFKQDSKFYTSLIRGRAGIRNRLQVNAPDFEAEKLGDKDKYFNRLATEWDNYYIHELRYGRRVKKFCPKTHTIFFREKTRKRFIMFYIQENLLDLLKKQRAEEKHMDEIEKFVENCESVFRKRQLETYDRCMKKTLEVKPFRQKTITLNNERNGLKSKLHNQTEIILKLNNKVIEIFRILNYYFLLMETNWRLENDWIHRNSDETLKTPHEVLKNPICEKKTGQTGLEMKKYYENIIETDLNKVRPLPPEAYNIKKGLLDAKLKAFTYLTQYNNTVWLHGIIQEKFDDIIVKFADYFAEKQKQILFEEKKLLFVNERNDLLKYDMKDITRKPLIKCVKNTNMRRITAICDQLYLEIIPENQQNDEIRKTMTVIDKFTAIYDYTMILFEQLDKLPTNILQSTEKYTRTNRLNTLNDAKMAVVKQNRFDMLQRQLRFHFNSTNAKF